MKALHLCAGVNAFQHSLWSEIYDECISYELDKFARQTLEINTQDTIKEDVYDLTQDELDCDLMMMGFPCQSFSIQNIKREGLESKRGAIIQHVLDMISEAPKKPTLIILENVQCIRSTYTKEGLSVPIYISDRLKCIGYKILFNDVLDSRDYGALTSRKRWFLVATLDHSFNEFKPLPKYINDDEICTALDERVHDKYYLTWEQIVREYKRSKFKRFNKHFYKLDSSHIHTIQCRSTMLVHDNKGLRHFTPRELFRFQGLHDLNIDHLSDTQARKQAGNTIPTHSLNALFEMMLQA